jgi:exodeoxyribonuclease V gamma subunit
MHRLLRAGGMLPHGNVGDVIFGDLNLDAETFLKRIDRFDAGERHVSLDADFEFGLFYLFGKLDHRYQKGLVRTRYANTTARDLLHAWVYHLLLSAAVSNTGSDPQKSFLFCKDSGWEFTPVHDCEDRLSRLLELYWQGLTVPLRFFPETSLAYCRQILKKPDSPHDALMAAHRKWEGNSYHGAWGESNDPYYSLCFKQIDPLDETFEALATLVFEPMLNHCRKLSI